MNVKKEILASFVMVSLMLSSILWINIAGANDYPPLPLLKVEAVGTSVDVTLVTDAYWDISGFDIYMHFNTAEVSALSSTIDPEDDFESFWDRRWDVYNLIDNEEGVVRITFIGVPETGGAHDPVEGTMRIWNVKFDQTLTAAAEIYLMNPLPRPEIDPWGWHFFLVDAVGFPHPERTEAPWLGKESAVPIPHVIELPYPIAPIVAFTMSDSTPEASQTVDFDASGSYDPETYGYIASYDWDFGDGTTGTGVTVSHYWLSPGFYEITLTLTDNDGLSRSDSVFIAVDPTTILEAAFAEHHEYSVSGDEDEFNDLTVRGKNLGSASAEVKAVFMTFDKRTGMRLGPTLEAYGSAVPKRKFYLTVGWNPHDFDWPEGEEVNYEIHGKLFFLADEWTHIGSFRINFKVVP